MAHPIPDPLAPSDEEPSATLLKTTFFIAHVAHFQIGSFRGRGLRSRFTAVDGAASAAIAVLDAVMPRVVAAQTSLNGAAVVSGAAQAVYAALTELGFSESESAAVARRVASEAARWEPEGRGTVIHKRQWGWR